MSKHNGIYDHPPLAIIGVHYERDPNGVGIVTVLLPDGRELEAIRDGSELAAHTAYVSGADSWPLVGENSFLRCNAVRGFSGRSRCALPKGHSGEHAGSGRYRNESSSLLHGRSR